MPLPSTRIIDARWWQRNRPVANGQMLDACAITRSGGPGVYDPGSNQTVYPNPVAVYTGPCRLQQLSTAGQGNELTVTSVQGPPHTYRVNIPAEETGVQVDDAVAVTVSAADPALLVLSLTVVQVLDGTLIWQRDLVCRDNTPATPV